MQMCMHHTSTPQSASPHSRVQGRDACTVLIHVASVEHDLHVQWKDPTLMSHTATQELLGSVPYPSLWLRYSGFILLYPIGVASELTMAWLALPTIKSKGESHLLEDSSCWCRLCCGRAFCGMLAALACDQPWQWPGTRTARRMCICLLTLVPQTTCTGHGLLC